MLSLFPQLLDYQFYAPLLLRTALGAIFLVHGWRKLAGDKLPLAGWLESMKFKPGKFWAWLVTFAEFFPPRPAVYGAPRCPGNVLGI